jgi:hypothetical protein
VSESPRTDVMLTNVLTHPAVAAWRALGPKHLVPNRIDIVREREKSAAYRLDGVGLGGSGIIAKRCLSATAAIERAIYEDVLPHLPMTTLRYYGYVREDDEYAWLFLEDVGRVRFSPLVADQRTVASRWLAQMHISAELAAASLGLPERGGQHYLEHLRTARRRVLGNLANPALTRSDVELLLSVVAQCDSLERRWDDLAEWCKGAPATLVHGDFRPKNVYVRSDVSETNVFVIDWETAGWGAPAVDLAPPRGLSSSRHLDLMTYWSIVHEHWPTLSLETIGRLVIAGTIFRRLAAIDWASLDLASNVEIALARLRIYQGETTDAMQAIKCAE